LTAPTPAPASGTQAYEASRHERTLAPQGERGVLFAPDLVGPSEQIVERLRVDVAVQQVSELRIELPYEFGRDDYVQILHDVASHVAPQLGWRPAVTETPAPEHTRCHPCARMVHHPPLPRVRWRGASPASARR
jgi:hypothetical protein